MNCDLRLNKELTGLKIKQHIQESGMTYNQIADAIGLATPRVIYDWINGFKMPSLENLVKLARSVETKLEDILVLEDVL